MELRRFVWVIWRRLWLILLAAVVTGGGSYWFSISMTPVYASSTALRIEQGVDPRASPYTSILTSERTARTYVEAMKARKVLDEVISTLRLPFSSGRLSGMVRVEQVKDTQILRVMVEDIDPVRAKEIASRVVEVFIRQNAEGQQARFEAGKKDLERQIASLEKDIEATQLALTSLGDPLDPKNVNMPEFVRLERTKLETTLARDQTLYWMLLKSLEDFRFAAAQYADSITILSSAEVARSPIKPRTLLNTAIGLISGLVLGVSGAFLLEYLDDTIKTPEDIERELGLTTLGVVGRIRGLRALEDTIAVCWARRSPAAEGYRTLRTNLQFANLGNPSPELVITSSTLEEGKSTTAVNLGVALARAGKNVVLVDSDLRRPSLNRFFDLPREPGLTNVLLEGGTGVKEVLRETGVENLRILTCGPVPPNPSELLGSEAMSRVIQELRGEVDAMLFDSPPVLAVSDATVLAGQVGSALLVIDSGRTRVELAQRAKSALEQAGVKTMGAVLNRQQVGRAGYYYYYHRYYEEGERTRSRG